jgi:hypothetical protein
MMRCPFCRTAAHVRTSRYMSESVKESYLQCQNVHYSATLKMHAKSYIRKVHGFTCIFPSLNPP